MKNVEYIENLYTSYLLQSTTGHGLFNRTPIDSTRSFSYPDLSILNQ